MLRMKWHKKMVRGLSMLMAVIMLASTVSIPTYAANEGSAATEYKFDFGAGEVQEGWIGVKASDSYDATPGYGWTSNDSCADKENKQDSYTSGLENLESDLVYASNGVFAADLKNGTYKVQIYHGPYGGESSSKIGVAIEETVNESKLQNESISSTELEVEVTDGQINFTFSNSRPFLYGLVIEKVGGQESEEPETPETPEEPEIPEVDVLGDDNKVSFDFGAGAVQEGWTGVKASDSYDANLGYGWTSNGSCADKENTQDSYTSGLENLESDLVVASNGAFAVDVKNGTYKVQMYHGPYGGESSSKIGVAIEATVNESKLQNESISSTELEVEVTDGQMNFTFSNSRPFLYGLVIEKAGGEEPETPEVPEEPETPEVDVLGEDNKVSFDFGAGAVQEGWTGVKASDAYDKNLGYGWTSNDSCSDKENTQDSYTSGLENLESDLVYASKGVFAVDVKEGIYKVHIYHGPYSGDPNNGSSKISVEVEGTKYDKLQKDSISTDELEVEVTDGQMNFTFSNSRPYLYGLVIEKVEVQEPEVPEGPAVDVLGEDKEVAFDFGSASSPVQEGWLKVTEESKYAYDRTVGYGWITPPDKSVSYSHDIELREEGVDGVDHPDNLEELANMAYDYVRRGTQYEFAVDVPNGNYDVIAYSGNLKAEESATRVEFIIEGQEIGSKKFQNYLGNVTKSVEVSDGQLNVKIGGGNPFINGLVVKQTFAAPGPLTYVINSQTDSKANITFSFNGIQEAKFYRIYQGSSLAEGEMKLLDTINVSTDPVNYTTDVYKGAEYTYYVTAVLEDGKETVQSNSVVVNLIDANVAKPAAPKNVKVVQSKTAEMKLEWDAVEGAFLYNIYRTDKADKAYKLVGSADTASYTDTDPEVTGNIVWYYKVQAQNAGGVSELSEAAQTEICDTLVPKVGEYIDRAPVAINLAGSKGQSVDTYISATDKNGNTITKGVYLSWRSYEDDFEGKNLKTTFDVYRNGEVIADNVKVTNLVDEGGKSGDKYKVVGSNDEALHLVSKEIEVWKNQYLELQLVKPADQTMPDGSSTTYVPNDMTVADLNGDGDLELVVMWRPENYKDNASKGYTGTTFYDAYDVDFSTGKADLLWRIDMGVNIRSGSHYATFQVWDYDGDGCAEIALKTADGTTVYNANMEEIDHVGVCSASALPVNKISDQYDYRETAEATLGHVLTGPEYFTMFSGKDGKVLASTTFSPELEDVSSWGDSNGNRAYRFLSCTAYLDGVNAYSIYCRGYYNRTALTAYKLVDTDNNGVGDKLEIVWEFDSRDEENGKQYEGQGNHNLSVADVDGDGKDEILYGSLCLDHTGEPLYTTGLGHGDAMHVSDLVPWNDGLEMMGVHEEKTAKYAAEVHDAETGEILMGFVIPGGTDLGRGVSDDIDPTAEGAEWWTIVPADYNALEGEAAVSSKEGAVFSAESVGEDLVVLSNGSSPASNSLIYWDGDLMREIQDTVYSGKPIAVSISKWNYLDNKQEDIFNSKDVWAFGSKGNLGIVADFLGDWREEFITMCSADASKVRVYSTTIQTDYVIPCLLEDLQYSEAVAWQNTGYNQPTHMSYMLSEGTITAQLTAGEVTDSAISFTYTAANDGTKWGHEVEGYAIYRADVSEADNSVGEYKIIANVDANTLSYEDTNIEKGKTYSYAVAAIVDGKPSYMSEPIMLPKVVVAYEDIATVRTLKGTSVELPKTVIAKYNDGDTSEVAVVWENVDFNKVGVYEITGKVEGQTLPAKMTVRVAEDYVSSVEDIYLEIEVGSDLAKKLPNETLATYVVAGEKTTTINWANLDKVNTDVPSKDFVEVEGIVDTEVPVKAYVKISYPVVKRFDFGIDSTKEAEGWIGITTDKTKTAEEINIHYTSDKGYGFENAKAKIDGRTGQKYEQDGVLPADVYQDFALTKGQTFLVDLDNGKYVVEFVGGATDSSKINATVEGSSISVSNAAGAYKCGEIEVEVKDGQLTVVFSNDTIRLNAMIVRKAPEQQETPGGTGTPGGTETPGETNKPSGANKPSASDKPSDSNTTNKTEGSTAASTQPASTNGGVNTGDSSNVIPYIVLLMIAGAALAIIAYGKKTKNRTI